MRLPPSEVGPRPSARPRHPAKAKAAAASGVKGILVEVAREQDRDLPERGRGLKGGED